MTYLFSKTTQIHRDLKWVTLMVDEMLSEFSDVILMYELPCIIRPLYN